MSISQEELLNRDRSVAGLRDRARASNHYPGGLLGDGALLDRPEPDDIARLVRLKQGKSVFIPADQASGDAVDLGGIVRHIAAQPDPFRYLGQHSDGIRSEVGPSVAGKIVTDRSRGHDPQIIASIVAVLNNE